jgi:acetolactate synthase-1/2/3 large subunit
VAIITGDGALGFYIAEMDTAVRYKLPLVLIVGNDAGWGLERELQGAVEGTTVACELRSTRYDRIMEGFGGAGETVESLHQIAPAVQRAFKSGVPYCINILIRGVRSPFTEWALSGKIPRGSLSGTQ